MSNLPQDLVQMGTKRNIMREIREYGLLRARVSGRRTCWISLWAIPPWPLRPR